MSTAAQSPLQLDPRSLQYGRRGASSLSGLQFETRSLSQSPAEGRVRPAARSIGLRFTRWPAGSGRSAGVKDRDRWLEQAPARPWASTGTPDDCLIWGASVIRAPHTPLKQDHARACCECYASNPGAAEAQRLQLGGRQPYCSTAQPCYHELQGLPCTCYDSLFAGAVAQYHTNRAQPAAGVHKRSLQSIWLRIC